MDLFVIKQEMLSLLETVGPCQATCTVLDAIQYVKRYVIEKKLFCPTDRALVVLGDDPLASVFKLSSFNLSDVEHRKSFMLQVMKHLEPFHPALVMPNSSGENSKSPAIKKEICNAAVSSTLEESSRIQSIKRKLCCTDFERPASPMYLFFPSSPVYDSGEESTFSIQEYTTEEARNSGSCSEDVDDELVIDTIYEVIPSVISRLTKKKLKNSEYENDIGSDVEFWADQSEEEFCFVSTTDFEATRVEGKRQCVKCNLWNTDSRHSCQKCQHSFTKPNARKRKKMLTRKQRRKFQQDQDVSKGYSTKSSQDTCTGEEADEALDKCIVCVSRAATALILHGRTAHNVCCYRCARKLQKRPNTCPACRRKIDRVVLLM